MFKGLLIKESLKDKSVLNRLVITKEESWDVDDAMPGQPAIWNVAWFEVKDENITEIAQTLSRALEKGKWYLDLTSETEKVVVFPGKVFRYIKGDVQSQLDAKVFGRSIGIPESQLDWKE